MLSLMASQGLLLLQEAVIKRAQMLRPNSGGRDHVPHVQQSWQLQIGHADFATCGVRGVSPPARASILDQTQKGDRASSHCRVYTLSLTLKGSD